MSQRVIGRRRNRQQQLIARKCELRFLRIEHGQIVVRLRHLGKIGDEPAIGRNRFVVLFLIAERDRLQEARLWLARPFGRELVEPRNRIVVFLLLEQRPRLAH